MHRYFCLPFNLSVRVPAAALVCCVATGVLCGCGRMENVISGEQTTVVLDTVSGQSESGESPTEQTSDTGAETQSQLSAGGKSVLVSFVGDLTLTEDVNAQAATGFDEVVGNDYDYCFKNCRDIFENDDMTLANLETAVTDNTEHADKQYVFKMAPEGLAMLNNAGIEAVNLANNHTRDYLQEGLNETRDNLDEYGITWSDSDYTAIYETGNGVKIGMFGIGNGGDAQKGYDAIDELRDEGADIVIASCHWGVEATYEPNQDQVALAHGLIDHGADIVIGTHPHRLQPIEQYNGKFICYSLSNFCFGGNTSLSDPDSAIIQCEFIMDAGGTGCVDYKLNVIPFSQTSTRPGNDYCPVPYDWGSTDYYRVLSRLKWSGEDE